MSLPEAFGAAKQVAKRAPNSIMIGLLALGDTAGRDIWWEKCPPL